MVRVFWPTITHPNRKVLIVPRWNPNTVRKVFSMSIWAVQKRRGLPSANQGLWQPTTKATLCFSLSTYTSNLHMWTCLHSYWAMPWTQTEITFSFIHQFISNRVAGSNEHLIFYMIYALSNIKWTQNISEKPWHSFSSCWLSYQWWCIRTIAHAKPTLTLQWSGLQDQLKRLFMFDY